MIWSWEEKVEAKPCPFCGSKEVKTSKKESMEGFFRCVHVVCDECGVNLPGFGNTYEEALKDALEKWNRRTNNESC